jgi:ribonuclease E
VIRSPEAVATEAVAPDIATAAPIAATAEAREATPSENAARRGRNRRKKPVDAAAQPELAPLAYAGPTPADPFGGGALDIFDVLERVENLPVAAAATPAAPIAAKEPVVPQSPTATDEPEPAPASMAEEAVASQSEPVVGAPIQPVVIDETAPVAERKRGWWRR